MLENFLKLILNQQHFRLSHIAREKQNAPLNCSLQFSKRLSFGKEGEGGGGGTLNSDLGNKESICMIHALGERVGYVWKWNCMNGTVLEVNVEKQNFDVKMVI